MKTVEINLDLPPSQRWEFASSYTQEINEIIACYWKDFEDYIELINEYLESYKTLFVSDDYLEEIKCLAKYCDYTEDEILIANLYYDIIKFAFACTAFAFKKDDSIWHARNLDWWTENDILEKHTKIINYTKGGKTVFKSVGWVGFVGVLSGFKPGKFAVTLNAIVSEEAPNIAKPISFLLREILEDENDFDSALKILQETEIVCDCLLLLSGIKENEMVVIERTPRNSKTRKAENEFIIVTNDYKLMSYKGGNEGNILNDTSCGRYEKTVELLNTSFPSNSDECFKILSNKDVKMQITVQQMVFNSKKEQLAIR